MTAPRTTGSAHGLPAFWHCNMWSVLNRIRSTKQSPDSSFFLKGNKSNKTKTAANTNSHKGNIFNIKCCPNEQHWGPPWSSGLTAGLWFLAGLWAQMVFITNDVLLMPQIRYPQWLWQWRPSNVWGGWADKHLKITFCSYYAAEAATGLCPVKMTVDGSTNHKALTTRPCAGWARVQPGMTRQSGSVEMWCAGLSFRSVDLRNEPKGL